METKKVLKAVALGAMIIAAPLALTGCTNQLEEQNAALQAQMSSLQKNVEAQNGALADMSTQVNTLNTELDAKEAQILADAAAIAAKEGEIAALKATVTVTTEAVAEEVADEEGELIDMDFNADGEIIELDDGDVAGLIDSEIEFNDEDYDVNEKVTITADFKMMTSIAGDEEFLENPYLVTIGGDAIQYKYNIEGGIDVDEIGIGDNEDVLNIKLLGKNTEIVSADVADESITIREGIEDLISEGETKSYTIGDKSYEVKCLFIGETSAKFSINGIATDALKEGQIGKASGIEISADTLLENEATEAEGLDKVEITIGENILKTITNGDEVVEDNEDFIYTIVFDDVNNLLMSVGVNYAPKANELDDDFKPIALGEKLSFPNNYINIVFKEVTDADYNNYAISFDEIDEDEDPATDEIVVMKITSENDEGIVVNLGASNEEVDLVYVGEDGTIYYEDDNDIEVAIDGASLINENFNDELGMVIELTAPGIVSIGDMEIVTDFEHLGATEETEDGEIMYNDINLLVDSDLSGNEDKVLTSEGIIFDIVEDEDEFSFEIPDDAVEGTILVK